MMQMWMGRLATDEDADVVEGADKIGDRWILFFFFTNIYPACAVV
jgi:hypothetical protein